MKNIKKITSILCLLLMAVMFSFTGFNSVNAETKSITINREGTMPAYIGSSYEWLEIKTSDGVVAYCLDSNKSWPTNGASYTLSEEASAGIKYILTNGYPNKSITGNDQVDRFITQGAIWWYMAENGGPALSEDFTTNSPDTYEFGGIVGLRPRIRTLVEGARNASNSSNSTKKAYIFTPSDSSLQKVVALYDETPEPEPEPEKVCVDYVIVGETRPDPAKTDPTPGKNCYDKGTKYNQEKELTTRVSNCKFNGWYTKKDLTGKWTDGTALNNDMTLYGAWDCGTPVKVPATAANTPLIILGVGLVIIAAGVVVYIYRDKKINSDK